MDMETAISVEAAAQDSHFRLLSCPNCGSDNVAYVQYMQGRQEPWKVRCFDCRYTVDQQKIFKHEAQTAWNKDPRREKPCMGCPDRYPGCSDHCKKPEYLKWKAEQELIRENRKKYSCPIWKHGDRDSRKR